MVKSNRSLLEMDRDHLIHPVTSFRGHEARGATILQSGKGMWLTDIDGNEVLDAFAGLWCVNVGYGHDSIVEVAAEQMRRLPYATGYFHFGSEPAIRLAERLASLATPGLTPLLAHLEAKGVRCAAVTNAPRANAELMLSAIDRLDFFEPLIIGDECSHAKPHPEPYLAAMRLLGVEAENCLAFEDSPSGAAAAVAAGAQTVGITSTQTAEKLEEAGCSIAIRDFEDPGLAALLRDTYCAPRCCDTRGVSRHALI